MNNMGAELIMIGHKGHPEVEGTVGQVDGPVHLVETIDDVSRITVQNPSRLAYVTQTTLSVDDAAAIVTALKERFPNITGPKKDDICYATQNRQDAVRRLARGNDIVIVVGSASSSNSNRLREVAENNGARAYLIDRADHIDPDWLEGGRNVAVTAGASAPEVLVKEVIQALEAFGMSVREDSEGLPENVVFALPKELA